MIKSSSADSQAFVYNAVSTQETIKSNKRTDASSELLANL